MRPLAIAFVVVTHVTTALPAQAPSGSAGSAGRAEVLILGSYHMANPGRDIFSSEADDVRSPRRQAEIEDLVRVLARFRPTRIAVEQGFNDGDRLQSSYAGYLAGERELTRNETDQIGFRLAERLGHDSVFGVDVDGDFPFPRLSDFAKANDRNAEFDAVMADIGSSVEEQDAYLATHTVLEALMRMNSDAAVAESVGFYYRQSHLGDHWNWAGADLVAAWFHRNIRIHANIVRLVRSPDERVLVIYGAGHLGWLRDNVLRDPTLTLRKLSDLVE
jgi:hypothetical protein